MSSEPELSPIKTPRAVTEKQLEANRKNSEKSTGPKTAEGKAKCSRNSRKHGLRASATVLSNEDPLLFEHFCEGFHRSLMPRDAVEARLVNDVATCSWRLDRSLRCETAILDKRIDDAFIVDDIERHDSFDRARRELPANPLKVAAELRSSVLGCEWIVGTLRVMIETLELRGFWYVSERDTVLNIFGLTTEDIFSNSLAYDIVASFAGAGWSDNINGDLLRLQALIRSPAPVGMAVWEYRHRVENLTRLIGKSDPETSRAKLVEILAPEVEKLKKRLETLRLREKSLRDKAPDRAMVDTSRDGELRARYEGMHRRDLHKSLRELMNYRKTFSDNKFDNDQSVCTHQGYGNFNAPDGPKMEPPDRPEASHKVASNDPETGVPDAEMDVPAAKNKLGIPPVPMHRLNELIDNTVPDLNKLLKWADELEAERDRKATEDELLM